MVPDSVRIVTVMWRIRPFRPTDESTISEILRDSREAAQWPPESYANLARSPGGVLLMCDVEGQAMGFVAARQTADEAEILNLAVRPDFRRKGAASALLRAILNAFRRARIARVFLELRESNFPARALYERHGFVVSGRRKSYYANPTEDALRMLKKSTGASD